MKRTALRRKSRLKPRRERERRSGRVRDTAYMLWVKGIAETQALWKARQAAATGEAPF